MNGGEYVKNLGVLAALVLLIAFIMGCAQPAQRPDQPARETLPVSQQAAPTLPAHTPTTLPTSSPTATRMATPTPAPSLTAAPPAETPTAAFTPAPAPSAAPIPPVAAATESPTAALTPAPTAKTDVSLTSGPISKTTLEAGIQVYHEAYCGICHRLDVAGTTGTFGPEQNHTGTVAGERLRDPGYHGTAATAAEYVRESILDPGIYLVKGYEQSRHHMPPFTHLKDEQVEALVQLLLAQK